MEYRGEGPKLYSATFTEAHFGNAHIYTKNNFGGYNMEMEVKSFMVG
jgi:hypothetical protein